MTTGPQPALTIYTDASFDGKTRTGSWGAVIRTGDNETQLQGSFREPCGDNTAAELQAIGNAIHEAAKLALVPAGCEVHLFSDCRACVDVLRHRAKFRKSLTGLRSALSRVQLIMDATGWQFTVKWIRGHQDSTSTCPHVQGNRMADQLARIAHPALQERRQLQAARRKRNKRNRRARKAAEKAALAGAREEAAELPRLEPIGEPA